MEVDVYIEPDEGAPRTERLETDGRITIGRHSQCSLYLDGDRISRVHLLVEIRSERLRIEDRSSNGTLVGEQLLHREAMEVPYATPIMVGSYTLFIKPAGPAFAPGPREPLGGDTPSPYREPMPDFSIEGTGLMTTLTVGGREPAPPPKPPAAPLRSSTPSGRPLLPGRPSLPGRMTSPGRPLAPPPRALEPRSAPSAAGAAVVMLSSPLGTGSGQTSVPPTPTNEKVVLSSTLKVARTPELLQIPPAAPTAPSATDALQGSQSQQNQRSAIEEQGAMRREIHAKLLENLDLAKLDAVKLDDPSMRPRVLVALRRIVTQLSARLDPSLDRDALVGELADEALGLGPLERFLADPTVSEIMVVDPNTIFIEQGGRRIKSHACFTDDERVRAVIERIVTPLGRCIDESSPLVDARLKDGSRVNAVIKPLALRGSCITIRKFAKVPLTVEKLVSFGALTERMARFLERAVIAKKNIIISGGTGSGKTTLLNVLSSAIPVDERIVTIEDTAELQLGQPHVVGLESRPPNIEGRGEYTIRDLVRNALRMRPDRIVIGECRGGEALDMLQAMNTGQDGSLTTTHANSPPEAIARIETLALMGGLDLPSRAIREQIAGSIHVVVQQTRFSDGTRRISVISEVSGIEDDGQIGIRPIFEFVRTGTGPGGQVVGEHRASGYLPSFLDTFITYGLVRPGEPYL